MPGHRLEARRPPLVLWGAVTCGLVAAAFLVGHNFGGSHPPAPAVDRAGDAGRVEQEVRLLKARLHALERRPAPPTTAEAPPGRDPESAVTTESVGETSGEARSADDEDRRRYFLAIEERLTAEPRDPRWADPLEERLRRLGEGFSGQVTVLSARCSRSLCRTELRRPSGSATLTRELARQAAAILPEVLIRSSDDPGRLVLYLQPEGAENFPPLTGRGESED